MSDKIFQALSTQFEKHRIVFWYDDEQEFKEVYETISLNGIEKIRLDNNEFNIKYRVLREAPEQKFLIYKSGPQPAYLDNWLLDIQLAYSQFSTNQIALWLAELELGPTFAKLLQDHADFFGSTKRRESLKRLLKPHDYDTDIKLKILAVCAGIEPRLDVVLEALLAEHANGKEEKFKLISRCGIDTFLWEQLNRNFSYESESAGLYDFVIELFKSCYAAATNGKPKLNSEAVVFLKRWKDSRQYEACFQALSEKCAEALGINQDLEKRDFRDLLEVDYFELIDRKIIHDLVQALLARTITAADITLWVRQRKDCHWFERYSDLYMAIENGANFIYALENVHLDIQSFVDGIQNYSRHWFKLDQLYRKYVFHARQSGQASLLGNLSIKVENHYSNNYLLKLNDHWQPFVDATKKWEAEPIKLQRNFYQHWVQPFVDRKAKVCVLISDAFRYEIADELQTLIRQEDRFEATLEPALSMLPSYTQLGMAALLPNTTLSIADNETGTTIVDGISTQGTVNRAKILSTHLATSTAIQAEDVMQMGRDDTRSLFRDHDVVYIYHNLIDKTGDTRDTEERVFAAAEDTLKELINLIKKLTNANASNLIVTSDHGFIYQNHVLEESDFLTAEPTADTILYKDRRFVLGRGFKPHDSFKTFTSAQIGLDGDVEVQIPKSINRLRLKGSGSRFVHGGATLQEIVIPVVSINKKRQSDVSRVEVQIIAGAGKTITSGQLAVMFYQTDAVTEKLQSITLRAGLYNNNGELISDSQIITFDSSSESPRDRERSVRFILSQKSNEANGQEVTFKLEELEAGTTHYREYKTLSYLIRRSFASDFDF